ncbi:MAG TPA: HAD-IIIA family hydrolase [Candidatus Saccharimonadales bacterium]|nr:HAD-IIIA family hydrolase [Candidatus Saccharimonadales bacterium]
MRPVVFLDRDGVINRKAPEGEYVTSWDEFEFLPGARDALALLSVPGGPALVVATNQRGIARGRMTRASVDDIHRRMLASLAAGGVTIDGIEVCPHEIGTCDCRKPDVGLFRRAAEHDPSLDLDRAAVVGDSLSDLEAAHRLGAQAFLVSIDPDPILARAAALGVGVTAHAPSLHELVLDGALDHLLAVAS